MLIKDLVKKLDSKGIKFLMKIRDIQKIEKKSSVRISVFDDENKKKHAIYDAAKKNMLICY